MDDIKLLISSGKPIDIIIILYDKLLKKSSNGENIDTLNHHEKVFYLVEEFETTYNNGGFEHFYCNNISNHATIIVEALLEINAARYAKSLEESIKLWTNEYLLNQDKRRKLIFKVDDQIVRNLHELDRALSAKKENLSNLLVKYIKKNKDHFII